MIERDTSGAEAVQINQIVGEAMRVAIKWKRFLLFGFDYVPPLFVNAELPVVARVALPRIKGAAPKDARR